MTEGASLWFPFNWTGARLFRQMNLSHHRGFVWIQINNCLSNLKENNDQTRDSRGLFTLLGNKLVLDLIWKSTQLTKIFTKAMRVHCLLLPLVRRERCPASDWKFYCQQNQFIDVARLDDCNQIIPQTFLLINFFRASGVKKSGFNNWPGLRISAEFITEPPQKKI